MNLLFRGLFIGLRQLCHTIVWAQLIIIIIIIVIIIIIIIIIIIGLTMYEILPVNGWSKRVFIVLYFLALIKKFDLLGS